MNKLLSNVDFYSELAREYDDMISFNSAIKAKENLLKKFISKKIITVADIGCGSGVDSIALALQGLKVSGFDPSSEMLKKAEVNAKRINVKLNFYNDAADKIPKKFDCNFDLVVSLGNTIANIPELRLLKSLNRCHEILKPGGRLLIQVLNYDKILSEKQRIISITESRNKFYIRFYDFPDKKIIFNILNFKKENRLEYKIFSSRIYPYNKKYLETKLKSTGFKSVMCYSDLSFTKFDSENSKDLVISAFK